METKEMTKEEVFAYLKNKKIICASTVESIKVQEKLFELGVEFFASGKRVINTFLLLIDGDNKMAFTHDIELWVESEYKQIEINEVIAIKIKEEKPKFDPKTLRPFDKVLIRNREDDKWHCNIFCHINEELLFKFFCIVDNWIYCIPYNEETEHLVGTTEEAPEFYRI